MPSALDQLLSETSIGKRRGYEHPAQKSAYQQFQQEYPDIDNYGRKVASGDMFMENMQRLSTDMENTRELASGRGDPDKGNILDYAGFAGMAKAKMPNYDDLMKQLEPDNLPAMLRKQTGFETDPNFIPKQFKPDDFSMELINQRDIARNRK